MDIHELRSHIDAQFSQVHVRLDRFETKQDVYLETSVRNTSDIGYLRIGLAFVITIILGAAGYLAAGYFDIISSKVGA